MSDAPAPVRWERRGAALWVWIDRESRRNAINAAVLAGIAHGIGVATSDPAVRAIVLTGAGGKAFCAGADLAEGTATFRSGADLADGTAKFRTGADLADGTPTFQAGADHADSTPKFRAAVDDPTTDFGRLVRLVRTCGIPLIARVNGACVAGGMGLMALCDLAVAADHARFGLPEVKVGVFPMQVLVLLRATMHARHINELCLTGELISAARAAGMGLVNEVVPAADLDARVEALVEKLRAASPAALRRGKQVIFAMQMMAFEEAMSYAESQIGMASRSDDAVEGLSAFNEKRPPRWLQEPNRD